MSSTGSSMCLRTEARTTAAVSPTSRPPPAARTKSQPTCQGLDRGRQRRDCGVQRHQRRRVVDQALALQHRDDVTRHADPAGDRGGGDGVRRRDHRAEGQGGGEADARHQPPAGQPHRHGGEGDQAHREQQDGAAVGAEVDQGGADRGRVEQRWQQADEHQIGRQGDVEHARYERDGDADDDQHEWFRPGQSPGQSGHEADDGDQGEDGDRRVHVSILRDSGRAWGGARVPGPRRLWTTGGPGRERWQYVRVAGGRSVGSAIALVCLAAVLGGCTSGATGPTGTSSRPVSSPGLSSPSVSSSAVSSPGTPAPASSSTATGSSSSAPSTPSAATSWPNTRPGEKPPAVPPVARTRTPQGADAFARYWIAALDWAYATTDSTLARQLYQPSCAGCDRFLTNVIDRVAQAGHHFRGGRMGVLETTLSAPGDSRATQIVDLRVLQNTLQTLDVSGRVLESAPRSTTSFRVWLAWNRAGWRVVDTRLGA